MDLVHLRCMGAVRHWVWSLILMWKQIIAPAAHSLS